MASINFRLNSLRRIFTHSAGQPLPHSHPHLLKEGELSPGIDRLEFEIRRTRFARNMQEDSYAVLSGLGLRYMTNGIFYPFHQNTDFLYLSGFNEPNSAMIIHRNSDLDRRYKFTMFVNPKTPQSELWEGPQCGLDAAKKYFGADEALPLYSFPSVLKKLVQSNEVIYADESLADVTSLDFSAKSLPKSDFSVNKIIKMMTPRSNISTNFEKIGPMIQEMKLLKSDAEVAVMQVAADIASKAFVDTMRESKRNRSEHYLASFFEHSVKKRGATCMSYVPVVAGGSRGLSLHYVVNNQMILDHEMLLMDAGAEFGGYVSDITRTWPVSGKFTEPQKTIYNAVLKANVECIKKCTESSNNSLDQIHLLSSDILKAECEKMFDRKVTSTEMNTLYPHHLSHYIGMDVHDTGDISRSLPLVNGMAVTIEPGLYIPNTLDYPKEFRGMAVRIEDDIIVREKEALVLTRGTPKEVEEIEGVMEKLF